eukprot:Gb_14029 [translate_table: standard]
MAPTRVQYVAESRPETIPLEFVRPVEERPINTTFNDDIGLGRQIPVIDMCSLEAPELREKTFKEIARASKEWGIFQVINHGISPSLFESLETVGKQFFQLPQEEKEAYACTGEDGSFTGYGTKLACTTDGRQGWSDFFFHMLWPPALKDFSKWPQKPSSYIEVTEEYSNRILGVLNKLLSALSISLELQESALKDALGGENLEMELKINYYPTCPQPEVAFGVVPHTDMSALTILKPNDVPGLQVWKDEKWITAHYVPNALIIHIGDQIQILSNGKFKSVLHRSLVNKEKVRMSWPVFCSPPLDTVIGPLKELIDDSNPPLYNARTYREYKHRKINKLGQ